MAKKNNWLVYALITMVTWGIWGAFSSTPDYPSTLTYVVWAISMIPCALVALANIKFKLDTHPKAVILSMGVGLLSEANLKNFYADKLFLGVDSISIRDGISTPDIEEASLNQAMIGCAREVIAVFDSSKANRRSFAHIAMLDKIDTIVTDNHLPDDLREYIQMRGIKLHVVNTDQL